MLWEMVQIRESQVQRFLAEGWEPFAVLPAPPHETLSAPLGLSERIVYLKRRTERYSGPLPASPDPRLRSQ